MMLEARLSKDDDTNKNNNEGEEANEEERLTRVAGGATAGTSGQQQGTTATPALGALPLSLLQFPLDAFKPLGERRRRRRGRSTVYKATKFESYVLRS